MLPSRVADYTPAMLDELTLAGEVVWAGAGSLPGKDGWVALAPGRDRRPPAAATRARSTTRPRWPSRAALRTDEAVFFRSLGRASPRARTPTDVPAEPDDVLAGAVWDLVWAGVLTNDTLAPVRALLDCERADRRRSAGANQRRGRYARYARPRVPAVSDPRRGRLGPGRLRRRA